ncbi:MAG: helix-turn-helix domain-containing protein [Nitrospirota bacterium]
MSKRANRHLSAKDRETVRLGLAQGHSLRRMASVLGRAPSPVSRESVRHPTRGHPSRADTAHNVATARARQPRRPRKFLDPWRWQSVKTPLTEGCSPEQIAGRLHRASPDDRQTQLSAETL